MSKQKKQDKNLTQSGIDFKHYPTLAKLITDKRAIASVKSLEALDMQSKLKLIEELSNFIIQSPEEHVKLHKSIIMLLGDSYPNFSPFV
jgi:hypothetical protein